MQYAIVDIETTGGSYRTERIIEIAVFIFDGEQVVESFQTLINPERSIAPYITALTGISNSMVENAPKFYEVAKEIFQITENRVFVAHNVNFDYWFVKYEFKRLGGNFSRSTLCTVKLARKIFPKHRSYSLGNICEALGIKIDSRHRAAGDALATVELFNRLLTANPQEIHQKLDFGISGLHANLDRKALDHLPEEAGVYYFFDENDELIYIGKSKNIQQRIHSHFYSTATRKALEMKNRIARIDYEVTGSELVALLKESKEIKKFKPLYNRAQRRNAKDYGLFILTNEKGYLCFEIAKNLDFHVPVMMFDTAEDGRNFLFKAVEQHRLCQKLAGLYHTKNACFHYQIKQCAGACIGQESAESYNERALKVAEQYDLSNKSFVLIDQGRNEEEKAIILVKNGRYLGYGFFDKNESVRKTADFVHYIQKEEDNHEVRNLIKRYLKENKVQKIDF